MLKTLEVLARGYVLFVVNDEWFLFYHRAVARRKQMTGGVNFVGLHVFKGWRTFFMRVFPC